MQETHLYRWGPTNGLTNGRGLWRTALSATIGGRTFHIVPGRNSPEDKPIRNMIAAVRKNCLCIEVSPTTPRVVMCSAMKRTMSRSRKHGDDRLRPLRLATLACVATALQCGLAVHAQVATDGSLGPRMTLTGPNYVVPPAIGRGSGQNLFHSFATLNVHSGQSLRFLGGSGIGNIIARVTGGSASTINGLLGATPGVNLFLLNPSGIFFGPTASIDLTASFYASTASHLTFAGGARFSATMETPTADALLPFQAPASFGFEAGAAPITLTGSQLVVRNGAALGLFGGDVRMNSFGTRLSILSVLGGTTAVVATGGNAEVALDGRMTRGVARGTLEALGGTIIAVNENASGNGGGRVVIRGGDVFFEKAQVLANSRLGDGRGVEVEASGLLSMKGSSILSLTTGRGNAGNIDVRAGDLVMQDLSSIDASCDPGCTSGRGGDVNVDVKRNLVMSSDPKLGDQFIGSNSFGGGDTGRVTVTAQNILMSEASAIQAVALSSGASQGLTVNAETMVLKDGAQIDTSTRGSGRGGLLVINARDILLSGDRLSGAKLAEENKVLSRQSIPSGFFSNAYSTGFAGTVQVNTGNLSVLDGAEISSSTARGATGYGGLVRIVASGDVVVSGVSVLGATPKRSGIVSNTFSTGDSGAIEIIADRVRILDRGLIQTQSEGSGVAGDIRISARDMDVLGGQVSSDSRAFGAGGSIIVELAGTLSIARTDPNAFAGLFARTYAAGAGGSIVIRAKNISMYDNGEINAGTIGAGRGGTISIALTDRLSLQSGGKISSESDALGDAGDIAIDARGGIDVNGASVLTSAKQSDGGNIRLASGGQISLSNQAKV
ncbi:MAG: filamentous hemagglutinin N-terminal domain-containing protein, partial [Betaproteobacteria bacterium]|nr:filamentous hemagglutinin N-terminal domain-containing protein [Betaproteobacteria bacterium]